jgi:hypothetical protein
MRIGPWRCAALVATALVVILGGCSVAQSTPSVAPSTDPTAARAEIDKAIERLVRQHPEPFHAVDEAEFRAEAGALQEQLPQLTPDQAMVGLMRLWARLAPDRDGHQFAWVAEGVDEPILPIRVYEFAEGVFVTAAMDPHEDLVGARITALGGHPIEEVLAALEPLVPRDGPATVPAFRPIFLLKVSVLRGLGLVGDGDVELTVEDGSGERSVDLSPVPVAEFEAWAGWLAYTGLPTKPELRHTLGTDDLFSVERLEQGAIYVRYAMVGTVDADEVARLRELATEHPDEPVILDLRQNPGGDNHRYPSILSALREIDRPGRLLVLTDRVTFSAASNFATEIEQSTDATFVGEPMGGGLNFWNDVRFVPLPDYPVPMRVAISTRYWQKAGADDPRLSIEPQVMVPVTAADYFAARDTTLEAALEAARQAVD